MGDAGAVATSEAPQPLDDGEVLREAFRGKQVRGGGFAAARVRLGGGRLRSERPGEQAGGQRGRGEYPDAEHAARLEDLVLPAPVEEVIGNLVDDQRRVR